MSNPALANRHRLRILIECAIMIALAFVLSLIPIIPEMPFGGKVTLLSMLPIVYIGFAHGVKWSFGSAFVYSVFQLLVSKVAAWGLTPTALVVCILFDYIIAFTVLGVSGFFAHKGRVGLALGTATALVGRFVCHYISGVTIWRELAPEGMSPELYSLAYNGFYMLPELIFTMIGVMVVFSTPYFKSKLR